MSAQLEPLEALHRYLGWEPDDVALRPLHGGLTNRSFEVRRETERFVLRLDSSFTQALSLNRDRELKVLANAFAAGLAPEVVFAAPADGVLLTRFAEGRSWSISDLQDATNIEAVCRLLQQVHRLPVSGDVFGPADIARDYHARIDAANELHEFGQHCVDVAVECVASLCDVERHCCHNDVVAQNLVGEPAPMLIDWEYACDNDPFFDLASLLSYHRLSDRLTATWLSAFTGGARPEHRERLAVQCRIYDVLYWLWLAAREATAPASGQQDVLRNLRRRVERR